MQFLYTNASAMYQHTECGKQMKAPSPKAFATGLTTSSSKGGFANWIPCSRTQHASLVKEIWSMMKTRHGGNKFWYNRSFGHVAADRLVRLFMNGGATDQEAINLVIKLARELLVLDEPLVVKDNFVRFIGGEIARNTETAEDVKARLSMWRDGRADARSVLRHTP